ncbi:MAG: carbohydrate-binding domain-containing protein [Treponema sp.]|nr:carbohydrate-binding domain-containing protein [Treponema sp.]
MTRAFNSKVCNSITGFIATIILCFSFSMISLSCTNSVDNNSNTEDTEKQPFDRPDDSGNPDGGQNNQTQKEATTYTANASTRNLLAADDVSAIVFTDTVYINLGEGADSSSFFSTDGNEYTAITAAKKKEAQTVIENVLIYKTSDGVVTLNTEDYTGTLKVILSGKIENGSFAMKTSAGYTELFLNNAEITSGNYPPIEIKGDVQKTYIVLSGSSTLTDGRKYGTNYSETGSDSKGSLYTKGSFIFSGDGSLTITEGFKHGIYAKDYIRIESGTITVNSTGRNGIQSVNGFIMETGKITIKGTGENTNNESRGIIVEGSEDRPGEGFIEVHGGEINVTSVSKGISAKWDIDDDAETSSTTDDPYPYVKITGGKISIKTTGTPMDESRIAYTFTDADGESVTETTKLSPEGLEGKQAVFITGGELTINSTDDCINSSRDGSAVVEISGGQIYAYSSSNDAIDSNGTLTISGGTIVALTATTPECAFDCDNYTFKITGGTFVGIGTSNYSAPTSSACTQSTFVLSGNYFGNGGTTLAITEAGTSSGTSTSSGTTAAFAFTIPSAIFGASSRSDYVMILSSPELKAGTSYNVVKGVTVNGGESFNGLYTTLPAVSGGTVTVSGASTSESNYVYTKSSVTNGGPQEGGHINNGPNPPRH